MSRLDYDAHRHLQELNYTHGYAAGAAVEKRRAEKLIEAASNRAMAIGVACGTGLGAFAVWFLLGWFQ